VNLWKPIDKIGKWILEEVDAEVQLRAGVLLTLLSIPFYPYMLWSGEPPVIYFLSVLAVTLSGIALVIGAQVLVRQEEDNDDDV
jgi:cytosine/uracil/thiamine/allantoin permease